MTPPSEEVDREVVDAAISEVLGWEGAMGRMEGIGKLAVMTTMPLPLFIAPLLVKEVIP